jgi:ABC-type Mn2+/Zn2+ transport system permease subunit
MEMLREPFLRYALFAGLLAGGVCAFLGVYVILRRIVFLGVALSEAAALGVALGLFVGWNPEAAAFGLTLLAALLFSLSGKYRILSQESLIGWAYVVAAGVSIILMQRIPLLKLMAWTSCRGRSCMLRLGRSGSSASWPQWCF